jgi:stearoyl-CoA desaturase (delta-9 desaturase)
MSIDVTVPFPEVVFPSPVSSVTVVPESPKTPFTAAEATGKQVRMGRAVSVSAGINWLTFLVLIAFHAGAIAAFFFFSWQRLVVLLVLHVLAVNVGIGMCYHRLLTHRGYQVPKWLEYAMTVFSTLSLEGGPIFWVATHRIHHQHSDQDGDPHTPHEGGWWAHVGWLVWGKALHAQTEVLSRYVPDLVKDRFHRWISKFHWIPLVTCGALLFGLGWLTGGPRNAVGMLLWGGFLRVTLGLHATWLVNSATHMWGSRRFKTRDDSRNNWWVALLSGGEGWHNNHHANPVSARHGLRWYEIDPNFYGIWLLSLVGLARKIRVFRLNQPPAVGPTPSGGPR